MISAPSTTLISSLHCENSGPVEKLLKFGSRSLPRLSRRLPQHQNRSVSNCIYAENCQSSDSCHRVLPCRSNALCRRERRRSCHVDRSGKIRRLDAAVRRRQHLRLARARDGFLPVGPVENPGRVPPLPRRQEDQRPGHRKGVRKFRALLRMDGPQTKRQQRPEIPRPGKKGSRFRLRPRIPVHVRPRRHRQARQWLPL